MKIVVTGPLQSGKSSYIKYIDPNSLNIEAESKRFNHKTTVAMDMGSIRLNGFEIYLFGTPGLLHFSVMRDVVTSGADGVIFIFDATHPEKDKDAITILNSVRRVVSPKTPIIYLANKQDLEKARSPEVIKAQNSINGTVIFGSSTKTGWNVKKSLTFVVNKIYDDYSDLLKILRNYEDNIKGLAQKLNKNMDQMRDFLNNLEVKRFIEIDRTHQRFKVRHGLKNLI